MSQQKKDIRIERLGEHLQDLRIPDLLVIFLADFENVRLTFTNSQRPVDVVVSNTEILETTNVNSDYSAFLLAEETVEVLIFCLADFQKASKEDR